MMPVSIPTSSDPNYSQTTELEGVNYLLTFAFNQRESCWYLSIATEDGTDLVNGIKLVCNWPLTKRFADDRLPPGELVVIAGSKDTSPPGLADLGAGLRCELHYFTQAETLGGLGA